MSFNLEDFIPVYPKEDDSDVQFRTNVKKEFLEVAGEPVEPKPKPGELYRHQKAFFRYMLNTDRMLNIQSVGTGKTCAMVSVAEYYKKYKDIENIQKVYILVSGPSIENEFKKQIACKCTNGEYLTDDVLDPGKDLRYRNQALTRSIGKWYKIMTYGALVKEVLKTGLNPETIDRVYSGSIFLVDEAHYLMEKRSVKQYQEELGEEANFDVTTPDDKMKDKYYYVFWKLFHSIRRSKVILSTATPMVNEVKEIALLMNLLLPEDMQMPTKWDYDKVTIEQLEPFFRGRVSYVRALETGAEVEYEGVKMNQQYEIDFPVDNQAVPFVAAIADEDGVLEEPEQPKVITEKKFYESQSVVYPTYMSDFQKNVLLSAEKDSKKEVARKSERDAAGMVFPDGSYGGDFKTSKLKAKAGKYIEQVRPDVYQLNKVFKKDIGNIDYLKNLSSKYAFLVENELKAYRDRLDGKIVGTSFCYSEMVTGGGMIMLSKILEEYGFERYNDSSSAFISTTSGNKDFCSNDNIDKVIKPGLTKKLRYAFISSEITDVQRDVTFELFNSPENANGDYCQLIIVTKSSREGINVFSTLRAYMIDPGWHPAGMHQALSRFVRSTSHFYILDLIKRKMRSEGKDPSQAQATIKVYKLASIVNQNDYLREKTINPSSDTSFDKRRIIDLDIYSKIEEKDIRIKRMMRFLKQCAFDCPIHYKRNINSNDKDGSDKCDYDKCKYICYPSGLTNEVEESLVDYSTFDIMYADDLVNHCRDDIVKILSVKNTITIEQIINHPDIKPIYKEKYVITAIDKIIKDKMTVRNRFGFISYINTDGHTLFIQSDFPVNDNNKVSAGSSAISMYKDMLFGLKIGSLEDIGTSYNQDDDEKIFISLSELTDPYDTEYALFDVTFDRLTPKKQVEILEYTIMNGGEDSLSWAIMRKFQNYVFTMKEPTSDIKNIKKYLDTSGLRRGRTRKQSECPKVDGDSIGGFKGESRDGERVYVHKAASILNVTSGFKTNAQFLNPDVLRIYKPSESIGWRDVYYYECQAYKNLIKIQNEEQIKELLKYEYVGTILPPDKEFRIIETKKINFESEDKRSTSRGIVCTSFKHKFDLIEILRDAKYMPDDVKEIKVPSPKKEDLINLLIKNYKVKKSFEELNKYSYNDLAFITKWMIASISKENICKTVQYIFERDKRMVFV